MRIKTLLLFSLLLLCCARLSAAPITGVVTDQSTNETVIGVTVIIEGTTTGTVTDYLGQYQLDVEPGQRLIFSYLGYDTHIQPIVASNKVVNVLLTPSTQAIEDILVVGYGVQKKSSSVGSISQVDGDAILKAGSVSSVSQAIQGSMPGVVATINSSKPGSESADIYIRGVTSWQDSTPLYLVDGVERDFNDVDPNEIASVSVLKDASATAVYGVKGANGVILVTTKRGANDRPKVNFSMNFGFKRPTNKVEYADYVTSMDMWNEACANDLAWGDMIPQSTIDAWTNAYAQGIPSPTNEYFPDVDWWDEIIKDVGFQQQYNVNISGGTNFVRYFASLGYLHDGDIMKTEKTDTYDPAFYYNRYNWRTNLDFSVTNTTTFSVNLSGNYSHRNQTGYRIDGNSENGWGQDQFFQSLYTAPSNMFPVKWADGTYGVGYDGTGNLVRSFDKGQRMYKYYKNFIDASLKQKLDMVTEGLSLSAKFSYTASTETDSSIQKYSGGNFGSDEVGWYRAYDYAQPNGDGTYAMVDSNRWSDEFQGDRQAASYDALLNGGYDKKIYYEFAVNYARSFGDHDVTALALVNRSQTSGLTNSSAANLKFVENDEAWVGRVTYGYKGRYLAEVNGAYTGSQKFAPGMRFDFFPSYSVGWRISEEPFLKEKIGTILNNFKVRYSYGEVGYDRSATPYSYIQTYSAGAASSGVKFGLNSSNRYGPYYYEGDLANVSATWETAIKQNLGFEFKVMDKLSGSLDLYKENREGILMNVSNPIWIGVSSANANLGKAKSRGFEVELSWHDRVGENFRYWVNGNYSLNENRVVDRNDPLSIEGYLAQAGKSIKYQSRYLFNGYYTSMDDIYIHTLAQNKATQSTLIPGDPIYLDYNSDGLVDDTGDIVPVDYNTYPQKSYGGSIGCAYKNFEVNALFYGVYDVYKNVSAQFAYDLQGGASGNYYANPDVANRWTPENAASGSVVKGALHTATNDDYSRESSTYIYQNASYFTLQNVELSYRFSGAKLKKVNISSLQLYLNGNNLFMITGFNKQTNPQSNSNSLYPMVKRYNIGARVSF